MCDEEFTIKEEGKERLLVHCYECQPASDTEIRARIEAKKSKENITKVSSGICDKCIAAVTARTEEQLRKMGL